MLVFIKFFLSGLTGVTLNFSLIFFMKEIININKYFANSIALCFALSVNYLMNRLWTFEAIYESVIVQSIKFSSIIIISIFFNHFIVYFCHKKMSLNFYFSKVVAVFIVFFWNFFMHSNFTFK